jgi:hypothetical protein
VVAFQRPRNDLRVEVLASDRAGNVARASGHVRIRRG